MVVRAVNNPRVWLVLWILFIVGVLIAYGQSRGYLIAAGPVSATDQEAQKCYFHVNAAYLVLHPTGEPCQRMRTLVGQSGKIYFVPDE